MGDEIMMQALTTIFAYMPSLMCGASLSAQIALCAVVLGFIGGTLLALALLYGNWVLKIIAHAYIVVIRGTPMLVQMVALFFILPCIGIVLPDFWSAVLAIGFNSAAYISEIVRAGVQSVGIGQQEAAQTLGFSPWQTVRYIVLPQALNNVLPALGNEVITLIKDSSLASVIGVSELTHQGSFMMSRTYDALTTYAAVGLIYLIMTSVATIALHALERKISYVKH
jgi:polar amino acid transport system permease protein